MYETALPEETHRHVAELRSAGVVVGIPSYRNPDTVGPIVTAVGAALDRYFADLDPVIVNIDGSSFDGTLNLASRAALPPSVRQVATRYQGLPGKGSALHALFEITASLEARALLLVEADVVSFQPWWVERMLTPILERQADFLLPIYAGQRPIPFVSDLLLNPALQALFGIEVASPTPGEVAMAGGVAAYFADRDVWETDVARDGVDVWMTVEALTGGARVAQIPLGPKWHSTPGSLALREAKFLQEVGTFFRQVHLHRRRWQRAIAPPTTPVLAAGPNPRLPGATPPEEPADTRALWEQAREAAGRQARRQWEQIVARPQLTRIEQLLEEPSPRPGLFPDELWACVTYDCMTVYNKGEGDPDKVALALHPLFLARQATLLAEAGGDEERYRAAVRAQATAFRANRDYFVRRWEEYISPEQAAMWRELGLLPEDDESEL